MIETFAPGELQDLLIKELCSGRKFTDAREKARERASAQEADLMRGHKTIKGLGKAAIHMPQEDYLAIVGKYGAECMQDRTFLKDLQRHEPQFKVASL